MSRVLATNAFIAKMCRGDAAVTRRPGWSNTRRLPRSSLPEMQTLAYSLSHQGGSPRSRATFLAPSRTTSCGNEQRTGIRVTRVVS
jgi:hypothetical protein